jgi:Thermolysin metallopeptidase, catalytic domain
MPGSKVRIWKQDPSVISIGIRTAYIPTDVAAGPQDSDVLIQGMPQVLPNANDDFLFDPQENPMEFDAVHTFTVVRQVLTMYRRAFNRNGITQNFNWQWGPGTISVFPRAGQDANAYYSRNERALRFFYFHQELNQSKPLIYTCRSFDIVAHETGHAVLDSLKPGFWDSWHPQTGGLHESFGDLTAIFTMLAQMDQCEAIIAESKGNLHEKTFFSALAEQFGEALGRPTGLRNADNDLKLSDVGNEVHDLSTVFTGAVYDILADIFVDYHKPDQYDQAETLFRIGKYITAVVLLSIFKAPDQNATYKDIAQNMIDITERENWKEIIRQQFSKREILGGAAISLKAADVTEVKWDKCCGSMTHREHMSDFKKALKAVK